MANRRYRERKKGITPEGITNQGITPLIDTTVKGVADATVQIFATEVDAAQESDKYSPKPDTLLPACVPKILHARYAKEPDYAKVIDRLLNHSLDELHLQGVWIPVWRYTAGPAAPLTASPMAEKAKRQNKGAGGRG